MNKYLRRQLGLKKAKRIIRIFTKRFQKIYNDYYADPEIVGKLLSTRVPCSCWMCGNPRKHFSDLTKQELCAKIEFESEIKDLYD